MDHQAKKILVVDDDQRNIFALVATLRSKGFTCYSASDAVSGIELLLNKKEIDIVLIDMMMPVMDGYQAIREIRSRQAISHIPVIAVTAQAMPGDKEKAMKAGANDYISKPIDVDKLMQLLARY